MKFFFFIQMWSLKQKVIQIDEKNKVSYLGKVNSSSKLAKGDKLGVKTYGIYLAPAQISGYNVCSHATSGCKSGCLYTSGRAKMTDKIPQARILKTKMLFEQPERFVTIVKKEITNAANLAAKKNYDFAVRFNLTSDLPIDNINGVNLLEEFKGVKFYDYSKVPSRIELLKKYPNYHLTFSYDGFEKTWKTCEKFLEAGGNVSVVFYPQIPKQFKGYKVISGDETDLRYMDEKGTVVGLKYKRTKGDSVEKIMTNRFIIKTTFNKETGEYET